MNLNQYSLIKEVFIKNEQCFKSKKPNSTVLNVLEPIQGIKLTADLIEIDINNICDQIDTIFQRQFLGITYSGLPDSHYLITNKDVSFGEGFYGKNTVISNSKDVYSLTCYPNEISLQEAREKTINHFGELIEHN